MNKLPLIKLGIVIVSSFNLETLLAYYSLDSKL